MSDEPVLAVGFCPFCRESFEGLARCPAHDLVLVPWTALPPEGVRDGTEPSAPSVFGHGRWIVIVAAAMTLLGFFSPVLVVGDVSTTGSLLAMEHAPNAWIIPACAFAALAVVYRRRSLAQLSGARFVVLFFGLVELASMAWTSRAVLRGAAHAEVVVEPRFGAYLLAGAVLAFMISPFVLARQVESGR